MSRILIPILCILSSLGSLYGQHTVTKYLPDSSLVATSIVGRLDAVQKIVFEFKGQEYVIDAQPIPDSSGCKVIAELASECVMMELPVITNITRMTDSLVLLLGVYDAGALRIKHLILFDTQHGHVDGWYAFFTNRESQEIQMIYDVQDGWMVLGKAENHVVGSNMYQIKRAQNWFRRINPLSGRFLGLSVSDLPELGETKVESDFFVVQIQDSK